MLKSKRFEPIREIVANSATDLSRAMSDAARRVAEPLAKPAPCVEAAAARQIDRRWRIAGQQDRGDEK